MNSVKILVPIHTHPDITSDTTLFFINVLPELKKITDVTVIWLVFQPNKQKTSESKNEKILDIHDYENFVQVLQKEKPDVVYAMATYSLIDYAISTASKYLGIPVFSKIYSRLGIIKKRKTMMKSMVTRAFEDSIPSDTTEKQFMKRGRFFFYKWRYLVKTLNACKINKIKSFFIAIRILSYFLNIGRHEGYPEFANTLHWLESEKDLEKLVRMGYKKESLVVTGNPMYDYVIKEINESKERKRTLSKPEILFLPIAFYEHGMWTKEENEKNFKQIVNELGNNKNCSLKIKIHPSSNRFEEYKKLVEETKIKIPIFQEGDAQEYITNSDIVISYASHSTALVFVLLNKKPLILCNFNNQEKGPLLEKRLAVECNNIQELSQIIEKSLRNYPISEQKIDEFLREFFYKIDGNASKRLANEIMNLVRKS